MKQVTDHRSNPNEQVETAVRAIGRSEHRRKVFEAVYKGKKRIKTVSELEEITGLKKVRVLQEAHKLAGNGQGIARHQFALAVYRPTPLPPTLAAL